ncbi:phage tail sheath subtilisin-like domain-containing protein [Myxococcus sp. RHSTA-1-4]|uniref:phage tail sheath family protein n=1 Tax=Myxococcus sp. RHSTA-1-4 TaxID=2874601 RepID=UPI001CBB9C2F|nr:phage tail sheath subtilisin-like domain-containing protein [Myxococcus sp. RHSTA-1-4]MBZ4415584.1 phage tail sheath subtilisin-like domain-containing protein [Myxococcus sp. RHSTA-1-4]
MPVSPTYPGVYLEEVPSGVRTLTGVATSVTAFIGRALRGPVNEPVVINSFADFERTFGGLWLKSSMSFAVRDFFLNGGGQAIVVRLYRAESGTGAKPGRAGVAVGGLTLEAANEGAWGNNLAVSVETPGSAEVAARMGLTAADLFNLTVRDTGAGGATEQHLHLTVKDTARRVDRVLAAESKLVRWAGAWPGTEPVVVADPTADVTQAADGQALTLADSFSPTGAQASKVGLYALENADLFNLLCIPPYLDTGDVDAALITEAAAYCERRRAMYIVDPPTSWNNKATAKSGLDTLGTKSKNAAVFFPRLVQANPLRGNQLETFAPSGAVAGTIARIDAQRGVWKAPAGLEATLAGVPRLSVPLTDAENGELNPMGINCLRSMPGAGRIIWGSRTLQGDDRLGSEWKYLPIRRLALFIEESLYRGTQWVVFEPNDEPLWAQIRLNVGSFMHGLFRQGAFQGRAPNEAYFVLCDKDTTTQDDRNRGIVNIHVGFAPLKPAEFVIIKLQQMAGQVGA